MSELNITIDGGTSKKLLTAGKFCDKNIVVTATGGGGSGTIEALDITANGTYTAPEGVDGYSPITVNVPQDGSPPDSAFVLSGICSYRFAYNGWNWFINSYGNKITTEEVRSSDYMFASSTLQIIPFDINYYTNSYFSINNMFFGCSKITVLPKLNNLKIASSSNLCYDCIRLRTIPDDFADTWDWSYIESLTSPYTGAQNSMFYNCYSLRSFPMNIFKSGNPTAAYSQSYLYNGFYQCYVLDELVNLPMPYTSQWTTNVFSNTFYACSRVKNITFALQEDGTPYVVKWKSQLINLTNSVGYCGYNTDNILKYNSGITEDKRVKDDVSYQALKNDPDWWTDNWFYSRYNHDSAVATINSLPDTSAYLATAGGTNTIKFYGAAGRTTDGGSIELLTKEEIAVATAKGWSVVYA